jgi:hypothetical protein
MTFKKRITAVRKEMLGLHQALVQARNMAYTNKDIVLEGKRQMQLQDVLYAMEHMTDALCNHNTERPQAEIDAEDEATHEADMR